MDLLLGSFSKGFVLIRIWHLLYIKLPLSNYPMRKYFIATHIMEDVTWIIHLVESLSWKANGLVKKVKRQHVWYFHKREKLSINEVNVKRTSTSPSPSPYPPKVVVRYSFTLTVVAYYHYLFCSILQFKWNNYNVYESVQSRNKQNNMSCVFFFIFQWSLITNPYIGLLISCSSIKSPFKLGNASIFTLFFCTKAIS